MLTEFKKKLRAYEDAKLVVDKIKDHPEIPSKFKSEKMDLMTCRYRDLHDFIFQGNITSEDIK
jgi:hypothetical protein